MIIGETQKIGLPAGWRLIRLGEACTVNPRRSPIVCEDDAPTSFVPMESVDATTGAICEARRRPFSEVRKGYTYVEDGDVLFAKITPCMQNGKHAIAVGLINGFGFASTEFHIIRPDASMLPEWVHFFLRQPSVLSQATRFFTGAVGQQRVPDDFLKTLTIPLPPIEEQRRIVSTVRSQMTAVETARSAAAERLEAVTSLANAYYRQVFGVVPPFVALPVTPRQPTRPGWRWLRLRDVARLATGHTPSRYHPEYWIGEIPWLQLADIRALDGKEAMDTAEHTNELGIQNSASVLLPKGTVCLSRTASVGFVTIMGRTMCTSQDFVNWVCGPELYPRFLMHVFLASRAAIRALGSGAVHQTIYFPTVEAFSICMPSIDEQKCIAEYLCRRIEVAASVRRATEVEREGIDALPGAVLRRAFAGEI